MRRLRTFLVMPVLCILMALPCSAARFVQGQNYYVTAVGRDQTTAEKNARVVALRAAMNALNQQEVVRTNARAVRKGIILKYGELTGDLAVTEATPKHTGVQIRASVEVDMAKLVSLLNDIGRAAASRKNAVDSQGIQPLPKDGKPAGGSVAPTPAVAVAGRAPMATGAEPPAVSKVPDRSPTAEQTVAWCTKTAGQGQAEAQWKLGNMYAKGEGVPQDAKQAVAWFTQAANQGHIQSQCRLGGMYATGDGVLRDSRKAFEWYAKAARQGSADAQHRLGYMYAKGDGVPQDKKQAVAWFTKAAEQGLAKAQNNLGLMYAKGEGVRRDRKRAVEWYTKAAEQGVASAQFNLGVMYEHGEGVRQNKRTAKEWFGRACDSGDEAGCRNYARLDDAGF